MGKPILYCGDCGRSLREEEFDRGKAGFVGPSPYCLACRPDAVPPEREPEAKPSPRARPLPSSTPSRFAPPRPSRSWAAPVAAAGAGSLVVILLALAFSPSPKPPAPAPAVAARAPEPAPKPEAPPPPRPPPPPERTEPELPPPPPRDPAAVLDRYLADIRAIRDNDPGFRRGDEVRSMLKRASELAGTRKGEVDALLRDYEKQVSGSAAPVPPPAPPIQLAPKGRVVGFTLLNADTDKPVPGFDPLPPDSELDLAKLGLKKIDVRINTSPTNVGPVETVINSNKARVEQGAPYSFTTNSVEGGFSGWTPARGKHVLKCRLAGGEWVSIAFSVR